MGEGVSTEEFSGRKILCDERFKRDQARLNKAEANQETLQRLTIEISQLVKIHDETIKEQEARITALEQQPRKRLDSLVGAVIGAVVAALVGFISGWMGL